MKTVAKNATFATAGVVGTRFLFALVPSLSFIFRGGGGESSRVARDDEQLVKTHRKQDAQNDR